MGFKDLSEFLEPGLTLPIRGKTYLIPAPSAEHGLRLRMLMNDPTTGFTDDGELREIMKLMGAEWVPNMTTVDVYNPDTGQPLVEDGEIVTREVDYGTYKGGVFQEMADDGISWPEIMHAGRTALFDAGQGRTIAEVMWTQMAGAAGNSLPPKPGEPKEKPQENRATRRAKKTPAKKATKSTSSKAGTGSTTRDRKRTPPTTPAAATTTQ